MASMLPPPYGVAFEFDVVLFDADGAIKTTPTLAAGDFVISKANGATANLTTTPSESPASSGIVRVQVSATEMEADKLTIRWHDASGAEWLDGALVIFTAAQTFDTMDTNIDSILTDTGTDGVVLANDAITAAKFDESTAYPLKSADTGATAVARVGADGDTLETLSDQMDATATAVADVPNNAEFNARTRPTADYFDPAADTVANVTTVGSVTGAVGSVTGAVGSVTGNVGGNVAGSVGSVAAGGITASSIATNAIDADAIAADAVTELQAGLATAASLATLAGYVDTEVAAILADTNELQTDWVNGGRLDLILDDVKLDTGTMLPNYFPLVATQASVDTIDDLVDDLEGRLTAARAGYLDKLNVTGTLAHSDAAATYKADVSALALDATVAKEATVAALNNIDAAAIITALETDTLPNSYSADGAQPTYAQALLEIRQFLMERGVSGVTVTVNRPDGVTSAMTFTLDDATDPTSITRAS